PFDMTNFNTQFIGDPPMPNPDYDAAGMRVHFIPETGELIFSNRAAERFIVGGNVPFSVPVRPTAPNPDDFGVDPADLDAAWLAAMAGDYADLSAEWATLRAEVETRWNDVFANYFYDFIEHGFDPFRFLLMPSQPAPPDPNGSFNFANYAAAMRDHFQYIEDGLAVFDDFLTDFQTFLAAFDPDAIPLLAPPAPPPVATSAAPQTTDFRTTPDVFVHNDANPAVSRFLNAFETYMASVAHYVRDMEQQQHMHDQFQNFPFAGGFTMSFSVQGVNIGELNPLIYFNTIDFNSPATDENGIVIPNRFSHFDQANQEMQFEFGTNVRLTVNAQARNIYSWQMFSDMQALVQGINAVRLSDAGELRLHYAGLNPGISAADLELLVEERLVYERDLYRVVMREKFSHMLGRMEIHAAQLVTEYTTLGSRLNRLELIYERLDENLDTLTDLMSQNENVDILEVLMRLNAAEAILQAAMQVGARINQLSLVNFI
ncbi:MAG: hypothetical protein FWB71_04770, partial [Defluviitaleaceae bacterium]|nr:hypothetical protein [Defluviitaleaceae bacterium]